MKAKATPQPKVETWWIGLGRAEFMAEVKRREQLRQSDHTRAIYTTDPMNALMMSHNHGDIGRWPQ